MADEDEDTSSSQEDRISRLEAKIDTLAAGLAQRTPTTHAQAQANTARRLDAGSEIEARVREEIDRIRRHDAAEADRKANAEHRESTERRIGELEKRRSAGRSEAERKPEAPERGITRALWGRP